MVRSQEEARDLYSTLNVLECDKKNVLLSLVKKFGVRSWVEKKEEKKTRKKGKRKNEADDDDGDGSQESQPDMPTSSASYSSSSAMAVIEEDDDGKPKKNYFDLLVKNQLKNLVCLLTYLIVAEK